MTTHDGRGIMDIGWENADDAWIGEKGDAALAWDCTCIINCNIWEASERHNTADADVDAQAAFTPAQHVARQQVARTNNMLRATSNTLRRCKRGLTTRGVNTLQSGRATEAERWTEETKWRQRPRGEAAEQSSVWCTFCWTARFCL